MTPKDVKKVRGDLSRAVFAMMIGTSEVTIWRWENGDAHPEGASLRLLELMQGHRKETIQLLSKHVQGQLKTV
jgi:DNA-binding transcriptional regulator YiaG